MVNQSATVEAENPVIPGGWQGEASVPMVLMLRTQRYSMRRIATMFGVSRRTLYNAIAKTKGGPDTTGTATPTTVERGFVYEDTRQEDQ